ncbi:hypothetical protein [Streptomyces sp. NPDC008121]|uniref:hypothetical protein n=1 Tax=Streptomyces sp. NPDC008121 TaxID=3364809 RepID=UPI0036EBE3D1
MGWTVLYIAFGVVALWLLGEVLLQYKARLRWRVLAFCGFLGVVLGVLLPSVAVIIAGAVAFAVGQTYVTLSFRRGFSTGWAIGGNPGASRRRRSTAPAEAAGPTLEVTEVAYEPAAAEPSAAERTAVYEPQPMPDDTGQYGVYAGAYDQTAARSEAGPAYGGYDPYAPHQEQPGYGHQPGYDQPAYEQPGYDYGSGQQQYAAYSDPYIGPTTDGQQYGTYDYGTGGQQPYADPYAPSYGYDTPPGGVWVPQQRDGEQPPYPQGQEHHDYGNDQQYRY